MTAGPDGLLGPADVRRLAAAHSVRPTKSRGQNFLIDANTIRRIVRISGVTSGDVVIEVGPGLGSLTLGLLSASRSVVAIEIDAALAAALPDVVAAQRPDLAGRLQVVTADALAVIEVPGPPPTALVANLPYNVAVPVLLAMIERFQSLRTGLVMVQQEVAERLAAPPGSKVYGVPSVKLAWYADARLAGSIPRTVFWPAPNVDSGLVAFTRRPPPDADRRTTFAIIDAAFAQRRKTLRAALAGIAGSAPSAEALLRDAGIDHSLRGEALSVTDFAKIAAAASSLRWASHRNE
ncbi:MAG: 16S rRNA (adenine(1518)-N(6)/adenine(1519)-N(6))-dimethyltransferase RsmA [Mycobacteriales bacterium]